MMIAARNAFLMSGGSSTPTARDYVQDGLIAMWDGIENAGWGQHDASATTWTNLGSLGAGYNAIRYSGTFQADGAVIVRSVGRYSVFSIPADIATAHMAGEWSYEVVFTPTALWKQNYSGVFGNHVASNKGLVCGQYENGNISFNLYAPVVYLYNTAASTFQDGRTVAISQACSTSAGIGRTWRDGIIVGDVSGIDATLTESRNSVYIGAANFNTNRVFDGVIHAVRVYSRALTAAEVAANYAIDAARFGL